MDDAREATREATATATADAALEGESIASQTTRGRARTREAERTTPTATDSHGKPRREAPEWTRQMGRYIARQAFLQQVPVGPVELWRRVAVRAADTGGWLPTLLIYAGGVLGTAVTALALGIARIGQMPFGAGDRLPLTDLWAHAEEKAARQDDRATITVLRIGYGIAWAVIAACYGVAYVTQFPALLVLLAFCSAIAFLTQLF